MDITCISDLHGHYPKLEGGDLLIVAGDLTASDNPMKLYEFGEWFRMQPYNKKICIAGNHDNLLVQSKGFTGPNSPLYFDYLCDSGTEFEGLKIWGSPWTKTFEGMNPHCKAFTCETEEELAQKWALIPNDIDILITHSPAYSILDRTIDNKKAGCPYLYVHFMEKMKPILHVCGHIHEAYGQKERLANMISVNASHVNERYQPVNKPIRIVL